MNDTTFSVRLPQEVRDLLEALSKSTQRSKNFLAREAITNYVHSEAANIEGIKQGLEDVRKDRIVPHEEVVRKSREVIAAAFVNERKKV